MGSSDLFYSSSHIFNIISNCTEFNKPSVLIDNDCEIWFLPYILDSNRKDLQEYVGCRNDKHRIILSHNDISGIQLGKWKSTSGFSINEIEQCCDLFINGHLHNGDYITDKIINLGNLTGQNFSEDAFTYSHNIAIVDTDSLSINLIENPYALNFYKIKTIEDLDKLKSNSVVVISCTEDNYDKYKNKINSCDNILASRLLLQKNLTLDSSEFINTSIDSSDHLSKFRNFVLTTISDSELAKEELDFVLS